MLARLQAKAKKKNCNEQK